MPPSVSGGEGRPPLFFSFSLSTVSVAFSRYSRWVAIFIRESFGKKNSVTFVSSLESSWLSCSDLIGDFDVVGLEVFFIAFEKTNSWFRFSLRSFRLACSLGLGSFFSFWMISVFLLQIGQLLENAWLSVLQWQNLISVLGYSSLLCPWLLHLAQVTYVSRHLFTVCPYLRQVLQLIGLLHFSQSLVFTCSPGIFLNLGGFFFF